MFPVLLSALLSIAFSSPLIAQASSAQPAAATSTVAAVPFYSQFKDISSTKWQKVGCGIASLAMVADYFSTSTISVNTLLSQGIALNAYSKDGWTYSGLIALAKKYKLSGESRILYAASGSVALKKLAADVEGGPVIASVHYKFDPKNPIPHLVVVTKIENGLVYVNDPAASGGDKTISTDAFLKAWKKRYIVLRPEATLAYAQTGAVE